MCGLEDEAPPLQRCYAGCRKVRSLDRSFFSYTLLRADLIRMVEIRGLHPHLFADDTQIYGSCRPEETQTLMDRMSASISDVAEWMQSNRLQLNMTKTKLLWCASSRQQHLTPN